MGRKKNVTARVQTVLTHGTDNAMDGSMCPGMPRLCASIAVAIVCVCFVGGDGNVSTSHDGDSDHASRSPLASCWHAGRTQRPPRRQLLRRVARQRPRRSRVYTATTAPRSPVAPQPCRTAPHGCSCAVALASRLGAPLKSPRRVAPRPAHPTHLTSPNTPQDQAGTVTCDHRACNSREREHCAKRRRGCTKFKPHAAHPAVSHGRSRAVCSNECPPCASSGVCCCGKGARLDRCR